jgi:hypothetical protein
VIDDGQPFSVIVDSAATPASLKHMLVACQKALGYDDEQDEERKPIKDKDRKHIFLVFSCKGSEDMEVGHTAFFRFFFSPFLFSLFSLFSSLSFLSFFLPPRSFFLLRC